MDRGGENCATEKLLEKTNVEVFLTDFSWEYRENVSKNFKFSNGSKFSN